MTFAFIRHGQTEWNLVGRMQGTSDIPLNDTGRGQAFDAAQRLKEGGWEVIVSSPLVRAHETASIIAAELGLKLGEPMPGLVERHYGVAEGVLHDEVIARWPDGVYDDLESLDSVVARGTQALAELWELHGDRNVVIVCHGTLIKYVLADLAGRDVDEIINGSVATFYRDGDDWVVTSVNDEELAVV